MGVEWLTTEKISPNLKKVLGKYIKFTRVRHFSFGFSQRKVYETGLICIQA